MHNWANRLHPKKPRNTDGIKRRRKWHGAWVTTIQMVTPKSLAEALRKYFVPRRAPGEPSTQVPPKAPPSTS